MLLKIFIFWYFIEKPIVFFKIGKSFLFFSLKYFSIFSLLKTLFSYWHNYRWHYQRGFEPAKNIKVFISNLISRFIGGVIRFLLIIIGIIIQIFIILFIILIILLWLLLPFIIIFLILYSFYIL